MVTSHDLEVHSAEEFESLPEDGLWEVADGRAILLPGNEIDHQEVATELLQRLLAALRKRGHGRVLPTVNVDIPPSRFEAFRTRVPDLAVYERRPSGKRFVGGAPPEVVIEVLATRRGNVERTEKIDDYARAGIREYWIVDPFGHAVEIYALEGSGYKLRGTAVEEIDSGAMPGLRVDLRGLFEVN